jgi:CubicO group peptidase (beta-lactamase class C family)
MKTAVDGLLKDAVAEGDVPGVVAVATDAKGTTYEGGFGKRVLGQPAEMTPDTVVWIASMTKAITGTAAMQQVERGKLSLDAPAKSVIPYLGEVGVLEGFDAAGKPITRRPRRDITLRHLLTHTAGFSYEIWNADIIKYQQAMGVPGITGCENKALTTPLLFDPGDRWDYGINIDWAGKMVEAVSGQKLGQYLKDNVLGPLGMNSTAFFISPEMRGRLAKIHHRGADGSLTPDMELEIPQQPEFEMGGGGLYGTAGDYLKFVRMMLNQGKSDRGEQVLKPETVALMSKNAMGDCKVSLLKTAMPPLSNDAEFFPGLEKQWGLSFMINNVEAPTGRSAGSLAWTGLANTFFWIDQKKGTGGVFATQVLPFVDTKALPLYLAFEKAVYDAGRQALAAE